MKIKRILLSSIVDSLANLEGRQRVVKDDKQERVITEIYSFDCDFIWNKISILDTLTVILQKLEETRKQKYAKILAETDLEKRTEAILIADKEWNKFLEDEEEIGIDYIDKKSLNLYDSKNNINGNVISSNILFNLRHIIR